MTHRSPSKEPALVIMQVVVLLSMGVHLLEGDYDPWSRSPFAAIILTVFSFGFVIYLLWTGWGDLIAQYRPQALFKDRVFTFWEMAGTGWACLMAGLFAWSAWLGPWDRVLRIGFALVLVIAAIPGFVHMWVVLKNQRSKSVRL